MRDLRAGVRYDVRGKDAEGTRVRGGLYGVQEPGLEALGERSIGRLGEWGPGDRVGEYFLVIPFPRLASAWTSYSPFGAESTRRWGQAWRRIRYGRRT